MVATEASSDEIHCGLTYADPEIQDLGKPTKRVKKDANEQSEKQPRIQNNYVSFLQPQMAVDPTYFAPYNNYFSVSQMAQFPHMAQVPQIPQFSACFGAFPFPPIHFSQPITMNCNLNLFMDRPQEKLKWGQ